MINPFVYWFLFFKASLFSSGGFSNLPSLHQDLIANGWANGTEFGQSLAIGQVSPGPNGLWVICLGYLTYGYLGAALALIAITLPPLLVLAIAAVYDHIKGRRWVQGLMRGVSLCVVGITLTIVWTVVSQSGADWRGYAIAAAAFGLGASNRVPIIIILGAAAVAGLLIYHGISIP